MAQKFNEWRFQVWSKRDPVSRTPEECIFIIAQVLTQIAEDLNTLKDLVETFVGEKV